MSTAGCRVTGVSTPGGRTGWTANARSATSRQRLPELEAALKASSDRAERRDHRAKLAEATRDLDRLIAEGPFTAEDMCSECATPMAHHGWVWPPGPSLSGLARLGGHGCAKRDGCSRTFTKRREARANCHRRNPSRSPSPSFLPDCRSLTSSPSSASCSSTIPGAEVRRGRANRWELWAPAGADSGAGGLAFGRPIASCRLMIARTAST